MIPEKSKNQSSQVTFSSGEMVPISGIWRPEHYHGALSDRESIQLGAPGELWLRIETPFPPCLVCGAVVCFFLTEEIVHISEDPDFQ